MKRIGSLCLCCCAAAVAFTGCAKPQMDPSAMKPPERPKELDQLEPWVGSWATEGEMTMAEGNTMKMTGTADIAWDCDRNVLVEHMEGASDSMKDMKMLGLAIYSWNAKKKKFYSYYFNNMPMSAEGNLTYNEATKTWKMTGEGYNPMVGQNTHWVGTITMPDNNTMNWKWTTRDAWKLRKLEEGTGTARRK